MKVRRYSSNSRPFSTTVAPNVSSLDAMEPAATPPTIHGLPSHASWYCLSHRSNSALSGELDTDKAMRSGFTRAMTFPNADGEVIGPICTIRKPRKLNMKESASSGSSWTSLRKGAIRARPLGRLGRTSSGSFSTRRMDSVVMYS